jgi:hypothetical protein
MKETIEITRTLTLKEAQDYMNECREASKSADSKTEFFQLMQFYKLIHAQLTPDSDIRLSVLKGEFYPELDCPFYRVDKTTGDVDRTQFWHTNTSAETVRYYRMNFYLAPHLSSAELLSSVMLGTYRPIQQDIEERVRFWKWDTRYKRDTDDNAPCEILGGDSQWLYFFTKSQRDNYAKRQVKEAEPEKEGYFFDTGDDEFSYKGGLSVATALNSMLRRIESLEAKLNS